MSKRSRQKAPPPPQPTRRVSDSVLVRVLDGHMLDSLSDIGDVYQRLMSSLGYKTMQWKEYVKVTQSAKANDRWLDHASVIANWRKACERAGLEARVVMLVVADGAGIAQVMRALKMKRECVVAHLRACLAQWSFTRQQINLEELLRTILNVASCCGRGKRKKPRTQLNRRL